EGLAALDLDVEDVAHVVSARVGQDRAIAQGPRAPFAAALIPADNLTGSDGGGGFTQQGSFVIECLDMQLAIAAAVDAGFDSAANVFVAVFRSPIGVLHDEATRAIEDGVLHVERCAQRCSAVGGGGLDIDIL